MLFVSLFVCAFGLSVRQSVCLPFSVLFRSFFLNFWNFASREEELRAPYRRRRRNFFVVAKSRVGIKNVNLPGLHDIRS